MVTHCRPATALTLSFAMLVLSFAAACDKVPLLAPTGSVITLFASSTTVATNGEIEIIATVIENGTAPPATATPGTGTPGSTPPSTSAPTVGAGTPVQNGTLVSFISTIGVIEPREARTNNGEVRVKFRANGQHGTASITAYSGGASGTLGDILVGSAGAERIQISASPQTLPPSGGTATITARVENAAGSVVPGVPVTFIATGGSLSVSSATTDDSGTARTILTATREAKVTANVAGKTAEVTVSLNPRTGVTLAGPTTPVSAGVPVTFTVGVGTTANVRDVTVDFGDGAVQSLGAISGSTTIQHTYAESSTYNVRATATEASGFTEQVSTAITILPGQPPAVIITASNNNPGVGDTVIFTATVSGATSTIIRYEWNFGAGATPGTAVTTGNRANASYSTTGTKIITVRVIQATGPEGEGQGAIVVRP
jgi:hypothetical protein